VATGSASAALTGLVFVATSLNLQRIVKQGSLRIVAAQSMILLIMPLFIALAITIRCSPGVCRAQRRA
jgi:modulator of FtsH protease